MSAGTIDVRPLLADQTSIARPSGIVVQKFGGTSVATLERLRHVAHRVIAEINAGNRVAVVVSAMAGTTNQLIEWVREAATIPDDAEHDTVAATGEQITAGLLALMLQDMGVPARSWQGWQLPIHTDNSHRHARITMIDTGTLQTTLAMGQVAVVTGFQGISPRQRITTLGRGGSDTTAVALAVALAADRCDIYTDVDGVYTADPRIVPSAQKMALVTYDEMLEMASLGAKVLQARSVEQAYGGATIVRVLSSFEETPGTMIVRDTNSNSPGVHAIITHTALDVMVQTRADDPVTHAALLEKLAQEGIAIDMFSHVTLARSSTTAQWTVTESDWRQTSFWLDYFQREHNLVVETSEHDLCRVSMVGMGLRGDPRILSTSLRHLTKRAMNIRMIATSEARITFLLEHAQTSEAARMLHAVMIERCEDHEDPR